MRADQSLYEDLLGDRRVKVVSGSSLMLTLMLIQELWKREKQSRNQIEIVERGGSPRQVVLFLETFTALDKGLDRQMMHMKRPLSNLALVLGMLWADRDAQGGRFQDQEGLT